MKDVEHTSVLIVGGGLVGLSMSLFLSDLGISNTLVERRGGTSTHPRARGVNVRTMEILRALGFEQRIRATESASALVENQGIIAARSLVGDQIGELNGQYLAQTDQDGWSGISTTTWALCDQDELEPLLVRRARALGARICFNTELTSARSTGGAGLDATIHDRDSDHVRTVRADYMIAADGARSPIRQRLEIPMEGPGTLGHFRNIYFHADLSKALGDRRFIMCYLMQEDFRGALLPIDNHRRWLLHVPFAPDSETSRPRFDQEECARLVRKATGLDDLEVEIRSVLPWESASRTATQWRKGPIFLVGDAAHQMPPSGAFGSNTGIQDAHNLAWKLAAVLRGEAGAGLLDTYEEERRPVSLFTAEQAVLRSKDRGRTTGKDGVESQIVNDADVILGYRYRSSAIIPDPSLDDGAPWTSAAEPTGLPGTRAAHLDSPDEDVPSPLDAFGREFTLVVGSGGRAWERAASTITSHGERLRVLRPASDREVAAQFRARYGVKDDGAVLVRPDGFVGWRAPTLTDSPETDLVDALARITHRTVDPGTSDDE